MLASELVAKVQAIIADKGDVEIISGLLRSGYGEAVEDVRVTMAVPYDSDIGRYIGEDEAVIEIVLSDHSSHSTYADEPDEDEDDSGVV